MQVSVHAEVVNPQDGSHKTTNDFHFTFDTLANIKTVLPKTYAGIIVHKPDIRGDLYIVHR